MERYDCGAFQVCYGAAEEVLREPPGAEYVIAQTSHLRTGETAALGAAGYVFHDRLVTVEVRREKISHELATAANGVAVDLTDQMTGDMYDLAYAAFGTDKRFCLDADENREQARTVLDASVRQWLARGVRIVRACHENETLGFLMAKISGGGVLNILLAVTKPGIRGRAAAYPLYSGALELLGAERYRGMVSTGNLASLNLQTSMGARLIGVEDRYILRNGDEIRMRRKKSMLSEQLVEQIMRKVPPGQVFSIRRVRGMWTPAEAERFEREVRSLSERYSLDEMVEGYLYLTNMTMQETAWFREHGDYRYHSFDEVNRNVYSNKEKMTSLMIGLSLAEFLWETLLRSHRFFESVIREAKGENYLEIGPGHGKYFCEAYNLGRFKKYVAVDVSPASIALTEKFMQKEKNPWGGVYELRCQDATLLDPVKEKYDFVTIQEVLEHLEDPEGMLRKISELLTPEGRAYALMPICSPSAQHIFLFRDRAHVRSIIERAGMEIVREEYITTNSVIDADTAEEKKLPINACVIVRKRR